MTCTAVTPTGTSGAAARKNRFGEWLIRRYEYVETAASIIPAGIMLPHDGCVPRSNLDIGSCSKQRLQ